MVKFLKTLFISALVVICANSAFAQTPENTGEDYNFSAFTKTPQVPYGQTIQIVVELSNLDPNSIPNTSALSPELHIVGQSQQTNFNLINGKSQTIRQWIYTIASDRAGAFQILPFTIQTKYGTLQTESFQIEFTDTASVPATAATTTASPEKEIGVNAEVEKKKLFIEEPVLYRVKVVHSGQIEKAELIKPDAEGAVIEQVSEPTSRREVLDGVARDIIEVSYLITPIKSGEVVIQPATLKGNVITEITDAQPQQAANGFDDFFDPFSVMEAAVNVRKEVQPFSISSNSIELNVEAQDPNVNPWLPLYSLDVTESLIDLKQNSTGQIPIKLGEPINIKVELTARGKNGESIPDIEQYFKDLSNFKIYADKPIVENTYDKVENTNKPFAYRIIGKKTQTFTLIPQAKGLLDIPEVKIAFWNLSESKIDYARLARKEALVTNSSSSPIKHRNNIDAQNPKEQVITPVAATATIDKTKADFKTYLIAILLFLVVLLVLKQNYSSQSQKPIRTISPDANQNSNQNVNAIPNYHQKILDNTQRYEINYTRLVDETRSFPELLKALHQLGNEKFGLPKICSAKDIATGLSKYSKQNYDRIYNDISNIEASIYASKSFDFSTIKSSLLQAVAEFDSADKQASANKNTNKKDSLDPLNPF